MKDYFTVDEISAEINVNRNTLYQKARKLGIDTSKIDENAKSLLIEACAETIARKREAKELLNGVEVSKSDLISLESESTLSKRLEIAKNEFNLITKSLAECQAVIDKKGTILMNGNNGTISSNPAVKTKCELLKQQNALQKTISDLESALKLSIESPHSVIDDE